MSRLSYLLIFGIVAIGCGGSNDAWKDKRPAVFPGTITLEMGGKPLDGAQVFLTTVDGVHGAFAETNDKGVGKLTTYDPGDGAVPGEYQIRIVKDRVETKITDQIDPSTNEKVTETTFHPLIPKKYSDFKGSGFKATVTSEGPNDFKFQLIP